MNLLAIDTSTEVASVALLVGTELTCEEHGSQRAHAQLLLPMIERLMTRAAVQMNQLDGIVFGCGPGSFTGLRIACSVAKGLAYAHDLDLIPVSSLAAIAFAVREQKGNEQTPVLAVLDARMNEMYWAYFAPDQWTAHEQVNPVQEMNIPTDQTGIMAGVGIDLYWPDCSEQLKTQVRAQVEQYPNAAAMIRLAQQASIKPVSMAQAEPVYVRNQVTQGEPRG